MRAHEQTLGIEEETQRMMKRGTGGGVESVRFKVKVLFALIISSFVLGGYAKR